MNDLMSAAGPALSAWWEPQLARLGLSKIEIDAQPDEKLEDSLKKVNEYLAHPPLESVWIAVGSDPPALFPSYTAAWAALSTVSWQ